jgi:hypothetical protein
MREQNSPTMGWQHRRVQELLAEEDGLNGSSLRAQVWCQSAFCFSRALRWLSAEHLLHTAEEARR